MTDKFIDIQMEAKASEGLKQQITEELRQEEKATAAEAEEILKRNRRTRDIK